MLRRASAATVATVAALVLCPAALAAHKDETATSGAVTATFSYDYRVNRYHVPEFSNLHVTVDRAGQRLVDVPLDDQCTEPGCSAWPAEFGAEGGQSVVVRDLDADDEPEVLVDLYTGGANCCFFTESWRYDEASNTYIEKVLRPGLSFPYTLRDLNKDGVPEFRTVDYRFAYKYGSNADTPRPLQIFDWDAGKLVDVTIAYPKAAARDAASLYRVYLHFRKQKDANLRGVMAAYLADSYNAHNSRTAWRRVIAAYHRGDLNRRFADEVGPFGKRFLRSVRLFLMKTGYVRRT